MRSHWNCYSHCDGELGQKDCNQQNLVIAAGSNLPPTFQDKQAKKASKSATTLEGFLFLPTFSVALLNTILVLWLLCNLIPWHWMEGPYLQAAFYLCNPASKLWLASWSARKAMEYFKKFHTNLLSTLKLSSMYSHVDSILVFSLSSFVSESRFKDLCDSWCLDYQRRKVCFY